MGHPQQLVRVLWMAASYLSILGSFDGAPWRLLLLGAIGAALVFTKINVGAFYLAALSHAALCVVRAGWIRSIGFSLTIAYTAAVPWFIMHSEWHRGFRAYFLLVILCGASTFVLGSLLKPAHTLPVRYMLYLSGGGLGAGFLIVTVAALQGISLLTVVQGVILTPMKQQSVYFLPLSTSKETLLAAIIVTAPLICAWQFRPKWKNFGFAVEVVRSVLGMSVILLLTIGFRRIGWFLRSLPLGLLGGNDNILPIGNYEIRIHPRRTTAWHGGGS